MVLRTALLTALLIGATSALEDVPCATLADCPVTLITSAGCLKAKTCFEETCLYGADVGCEVHSKQRRDTGPGIKSEDGNVVVVTDTDNKVGYRIGGNDTVYISDMPDSLRGYTDATVYAINTGFKFGALKADAAVSKAVLESERRLSEQINTVRTDAQTILDAGQKAANASQKEFARSLEGVLKEATEAGGAAKDLLDDLMDCTYPGEFFDIPSKACKKVSVCKANQMIVHFPTTMSDQECKDHKTCNKTGEWASSNGTMFSDRVCLKHKTCTEDEQLSAAGTSWSDVECFTPSYSCYELNKNGDLDEDGPNTVYLDSGPFHDQNTVKFDKSKTIPVFCKFVDDKWYTLIEMIRSNQQHNSPYDWKTTTTRWPSNSNIGTIYQNNQNAAARLADAEQNSIFKHSKGYILTWYNNNEPKFFFVDRFGDPDSGKHILSPKHTCSHKARLNMAKAYRAPDTSTSMGYCFNDGQKYATNNCICGDRTDTTMSFNQCTGNYGNWRRYNQLETENLVCSGLHRKCYNYGGLYTLGDTYGCNGNNGRNIQGSMWLFYYGGGTVTHIHDQGGAYGSRWMA